MHDLKNSIRYNWENKSTIFFLPKSNDRFKLKIDLKLIFRPRRLLTIVGTSKNVSSSGVTDRNLHISGINYELLISVNYVASTSNDIRSQLIVRGFVDPPESECGISVRSTDARLSSGEVEKNFSTHNSGYKWLRGGSGALFCQNFRLSNWTLKSADLTFLLSIRRFDYSLSLFAGTKICRWQMR